MAQPPTNSEKNQDFQLFHDVVEPMLQFSLNENNGTRSHLGMIGTDLHASAPSEDVIHLIFPVRLLQVGPAFRQNVDAGAHGRHAQEFKIAFVFRSALPNQIVDVKKARHTKN